MSRGAAKVTRLSFTREQVEELIEHLIGLLDSVDPDPDLEPSLGLNGYPWCNMAEAADLESQCEDEGAQCDDEGVLDNEDLSNCSDDAGPSYPADQAERNRVIDSVVAVNAKLRAVMARHGLSPVPALSNMCGSLWPPQ